MLPEYARALPQQLPGDTRATLLRLRDPSPGGVSPERIAARFEPPLKIMLDLRTATHLDGAAFESTFEGLLGG